MKALLTTLCFFCFITLTTMTIASPSADHGPVRDYRQVLKDVNMGNEVSLAHFIAAFTKNDTLDSVALAALTKDLKQENEATRETLIEFLVKLGRHLDNPVPGKERAIRDKSILHALLQEGFAKSDDGALTAERQLLQHATREDLYTHRKLITQALSNSTYRYALIVAKAKIIDARPIIQKALEGQDLPEHYRTRFRVVLAALGDTTIEDSYLSSLEKAEREAPPAPKTKYYDIGAAKDGRRVARLLKTIGFIGTDRSLRTICAYLRSDLKTYVVNQREESIRFEAVEALRFNFSDEIVLRRPDSQADWEAVEKFCTARVGANFVGPTPPEVFDFPYPHY